jgi:hypothetical protein
MIEPREKEDLVTFVQKNKEELKMQKNLIKEMSKLRQLLDKKGISHRDTVGSFFNSIYENVTFKKDDIKYTVSRREHHNSKGVLLYNLLRVDKVTSISEEYGYFQNIFNLPVPGQAQPKNLISFCGNYELDYDKDYLSSLSILF